MSISRAASSTVRVMGPAWARGPKGLAGYSGIRPWVGLKPTIPQKEAGMRTLPPPSVPTETGPIPAATAAAEPPEDPPAVSRGSTGLRVMPCRGLSVTAFHASSGVVVLPRKTMPSARSRAATGESTSHGWSGSMALDPRRVGQPAVRKMSLMETGTPSSRPRGWSCCHLASAWRACPRAASGSTRQ